MSNHTCLVVDDDPSLRAYLKLILARRYFQALEAEDGVEGLHLVQELGETVELVVSDIEMPGGDGLTFAHAVRDVLPRMPIVLISAAPNPEEDCPSEAFEFLQKPFSPTMLLGAIDKATGTVGPSEIEW
jgi:DNA-binding NtrC family response regulator